MRAPRETPMDYAESDVAALVFYSTAAELYDALASRGLDDVSFYIEAAQRIGSPVLELGCGTGRVLIPLAEAGIDVVGLDITPAMLSIARERLFERTPDVRARAELVEGDMRSFSLARRFPLAIVPCRGFAHLLTPEDQRAALGCIREHLEARGTVVIPLLDPRLELLAEGLEPGGATIRKAQELTHPVSGNRLVVWRARRVDPTHQRIHDHRIFEEVNREGRVVSRLHAPLIMRYTTRYEMEHLLHNAGFEVENLYGDFDRGPFRYGGEQVWVARRRD